MKNLFSGVTGLLMFGLLIFVGALGWYYGKNGIPGLPQF